MIKLTTYPDSPHQATVFLQWFANLSGLTPEKIKGNAFYFAPKQNSIITKEKIFEVLHREMAFLGITNYKVK